MTNSTAPVLRFVAPRAVTRLGVANIDSEARVAGPASKRLAVIVRTAESGNGPAGVVAKVIEGDPRKTSFRIHAETRYVGSAAEIVELAAAHGLVVDTAFAVRMFEGR